MSFFSNLRESLIGLLWTQNFAKRPSRAIHTEAFTEQELLNIKTREETDRARLLSRKGASEWTIDGYTVWARDEANAKRKVANLKHEPH